MEAYVDTSSIFDTVEMSEVDARLGERLDEHSLVAAVTAVEAVGPFERGRVLAGAGFADEAIAAYRAALALDPNQPNALTNLSILLASHGHFAEAAEMGLRAQALVPHSAEILNNCAVVLQQGGQTSAAAEFYRRALEINPEYASAWANLGVAYQEMFRFDDAVNAFDRAVKLSPEFHVAIVEGIKLRRHVCDWSRYGADRQLLLNMLNRRTDAVFMLLLMSFASTPEQQLACARQHMERHNANTDSVSNPIRTDGGRLRVGYLSGDYREHPVGRLLPELLAQHDRGTVDVFGYALGLEDSGRVRTRIRRACEHFVDLHSLSNREAVARIRADGIDVLVDLTGPTSGSRLEILTQRPAPVQVSFLGWPGTTGADFIDYVVGDPFLIPADHEPFYSEKIVQLPQCYQPSDPYRAGVLPSLCRADCGLPDEAFVFCSFNNTSKLTPHMFDVWLRLLAKVENSVLWLYCKTPCTMTNLKAYAEARGIGGERIVFAPVSTIDYYLSRLRLADLFLDSFPYNAGATCNDALWMGLPVVTMIGDTYVSRMAGSLLRAAGLPQLIAGSIEAYEALAFRLATEPDLLFAVKKRLDEKNGSALFDMPHFAAAWERALMHMHRLARAGVPPTAFAIPDASY